VYHTKCLAPNARPRHDKGSEWQCPMCDSNGSGPTQPNTKKARETEGRTEGRTEGSRMRGRSSPSAGNARIGSHAMRPSKRYRCGFGRKGYCGYDLCSNSSKQVSVPTECTVCTNRKLNAQGFCCDEHWTAHHMAMMQ
jgi:hypothetical protein